MNNPIFKRDILIRQKVEKEIENFIIKNKKEDVLHMTEFDDYVSSISSLPEDNLCTSDEVLLKTTLFGLFLKYRIMEDEKGLNISLNNKKTPVTVVKTSRPTSPIIDNNLTRYLGVFSFGKKKS